ncbi:hypothetical protein A0U92_06795 [Acetobacter aceti]|uniref:Uncharacterized protein n=1 Tax=Acetobacter aceti TaxID=435 RepID=A0A1U9KFF4_ACEAC|nr:hypothetical protein A0U92_06795 [Acetobacter aceti]
METSRTSGKWSQALRSGLFKSITRGRGSLSSCVSPNGLLKHNIALKMDDIATATISYEKAGQILH